MHAYEREVAHLLLVLLVAGRPVGSMCVFNSNGRGAEFHRSVSHATCHEHTRVAFVASLAWK